MTSAAGVSRHPGGAARPGSRISFAGGTPGNAGSDSAMRGWVPRGRVVERAPVGGLVLVDVVDEGQVRPCAVADSPAAGGTGRAGDMEADEVRPHHDQALPRRGRAPPAPLSVMKRSVPWRRLHTIAHARGAPSLPRCRASRPGILALDGSRCDRAPRLVRTRDGCAGRRTRHPVGAGPAVDGVPLALAHGRHQVGGQVPQLEVALARDRREERHAHPR